MLESNLVDFFFSSRRRHTRCSRDWSSDVCSSDLIERGKRLVHEEHFRFDNQCAGHAYALLHAAGKLLGVSRLETVQPDGVQDAQSALATLKGRDAAGFERSFDVFNYRKPGKERETLEDNGNEIG